MQTVSTFLKLYGVVLPTNPDGICLNVLLSISPIQTLLADSSQALFCCCVLYRGNSLGIPHWYHFSTPSSIRVAVCSHRKVLVIFIVCHCFLQVLYSSLSCHILIFQFSVARLCVSFSLPSGLCPFRLIQIWLRKDLAYLCAFRLPWTWATSSDVW